MPDPVTEVLAGFGQTALTVRVSRVLFQAIPGAPEFVHYDDVAGAASRLGQTSTSAFEAELAAELARDNTRRVLWVARKIDLADATLASYSGISNAISWMVGGQAGRKAFESDRQQAIDAGLKVLATAYMTKIFPGTVRERVQALAALPAGREMLLYLCVVEIALPFLDNVLEKGWDFARQSIADVSGETESRFGQAVGGADLGEIRATAEEMSGVLGQAMGALREHLVPIVARLRGAMPTVLNVTGSATGAMATALDAMPVWSYLGARLATEACVLRAAKRGTRGAAGAFASPLSS